MPALFSTFRFTANDGTGDTLVYPVVRGLKRRWEREGDTRSYRIKLATALTFRKADYIYFRAIYDTGTCTEVSLLIENYCGGAWVTWFEGIVPIPEGNYNASFCEVKYNILPNDVYECANKSFDKGGNWLEYGDRYELKTYIGTIGTVTCSVGGAPFPGDPNLLWFCKGCWGTGYTNSQDPDPALAWRPISHTQHYYLSTFDAHTTWAREEASSVLSPPGQGWIHMIGTTWARPLSVGFPVITQKLIVGYPYETSFEAATINSAPISNARLLKDVLEGAVTDSGCAIDQVVSNFFNINPDGSAPTNDVYDFAADNYSDILFFQKSDIVRAFASNDATRFTITLKEFLNELKILNLFWAIVNDAGTIKFRIEHYTYFEGAAGQDLTTLEDGKYIVGLDSFKSDLPIPNFESFAYQESYRADFLVKRITYPVDCATVQGDERTASQLCADLDGLLENPDAGLEGFFLVATIKVATVYYLNTLGGNGNGAFAWKYVIPKLWADGRFHADATANVTGYVVNSVRKSKAQGPITIKFCCSDAFEASEQIGTQLGFGEVTSAEQDTELGTLKIELLQ